MYEVTDLDLAAASLASYNVPATVETGDARAVLSLVKGVQVIACVGTRSMADLWRDISAVVTRCDPQYGAISDAFFSEAEQLLWRIWPLLTSAPVAVTGHSKGAAEAQALALLLMRMGRTVWRLGAFEPPQLGTLNGALDIVPGIATRQQINDLMGDPITSMPIARGHAQKLTVLEWPGLPPLDVLAYHKMSGIYAAMQRRSLGT